MARYFSPGRQPDVLLDSNPCVLRYLTNYSTDEQITNLELATTEVKKNVEQIIQVNLL